MTLCLKVQRSIILLIDSLFLPVMQGRSANEQKSIWLGKFSSPPFKKPPLPGAFYCAKFLFLPSLPPECFYLHAQQPPQQHQRQQHADTKNRHQHRHNKPKRQHKHSADNSPVVSFGAGGVFSGPGMNGVPVFVQNFRFNNFFRWDDFFFFHTYIIA